MMKKPIRALSAALVLSLLLVSCAATGGQPADTSQKSASGASQSAADPSSTGTGGGGTASRETKATLVADFSAGAADAEALGLIHTTEATLPGDVTIEALADALSAWSGLAFTISSSSVADGSATVAWGNGSTLVAGLGDREQKDDFRFQDVESLNWFMMDSLAQTIKKNLSVSTVYYCAEDGSALVFTGMTGLSELPVDQSYEGSAFFREHSGGRGDVVTEGDPLTQEQASVVLSDALAGRVAEMSGILYDGDGEVDGAHVFYFSFGYETEKKFTAEGHFAVADDGTIYELDEGTGEYVLFTA